VLEGASRADGLDAIAGVVNIITRRDFDGGQVTLNYGEYSRALARRRAWTWPGAEWRPLQPVPGASWTKQDPVFAKDREQSRFPIPGTGLAFGSGGIPQGRFMFTDPNTGAVQNIVPNTGVSNPRYDGSASCSRTMTTTASPPPTASTSPNTTWC
jgi:iron complex outermembrane receptor protein